MGKVLSSFRHGRAGAISRAVDDVVASLPNSDETPIAFGAPVFLNATGTCVKNVSTESTMDKFVGFAVRSASKTPDEYGSCEGRYNPGEPVDVLTLGSIVVSISGSGIVPGRPVSLDLTTGKCVYAAAESETVKAFPNCHFRTIKDPDNLAEVVLNTRNTI